MKTSSASSSQNLFMTFLGVLFASSALLLDAGCSSPVVTGAASCSSASQGSCSKSGYCLDFPSSATALAVQANNCSTVNSTAGSSGGSGNMTYSSSSCATLNASQTLVFSCLTNGSNVNNAILVRFYSTYTPPSGTGSTVSSSAGSICTTAGGTACQ